MSLGGIVSEVYLALRQGLGWQLNSEKVMRFGTVSVVIPCYNEEENLSELFSELERLSATLAVDGMAVEAVIVDNHSEDTTWFLLNEWLTIPVGFRRVLIQHPENLGIQHSLLSGVKASTGDAITILQSDLQDPPELIAEMVKSWQSGHDFVATKIKKRDGALLPRIGAWGFYRVLSMVSDSSVLADTSDFYLFDKRLRKKLIEKSGSTPFLRSTLSSLADPDSIIVYRRRDRAEGESNFNLSRRIDFALDAILRDLGGLVKKMLIGSMTLFFAGGAILLSVFFLLIGDHTLNLTWLLTAGVVLLAVSPQLAIASIFLELQTRIYKDLPRTVGSMEVLKNVSEANN